MKTGEVCGSEKGKMGKPEERRTRRGKKRWGIEGRGLLFLDPPSPRSRVPPSPMASVHGLPG